MLWISEEFVQGFAGTDGSKLVLWKMRGYEGYMK